jgi:site-specific DNA recombinase
VLRAELQAIADQANDQAALLRLAGTLTAFLARLHGAADTLSITERQRIVRLVVKDILIGDDTITIRHSISLLSGPPRGASTPPSQTAGSNYLLCKGSDLTRARKLFANHRGLEGYLRMAIETKRASRRSLENVEICRSAPHSGIQGTL